MAFDHFEQLDAVEASPLGKIAISAALHCQLGIPYEQIAPAGLAQRWPQIDFTGIAIGVLQSTMGALHAHGTNLL